MARDFPPMPPKTAKEEALQRTITAGLNALAARLQQRNLDNAVLLAQQAALGRGPVYLQLVEHGLIDYFQEIGRRFSELLDTPQPPKLRTIEGGRPK